MSFNTLCVRLEDAHHTPADLGCVCLRHGSLTFELRQALTDVFSSWNPNLEKDNPQRLTALLTDSLPDLWGRKVANELLKARARKDEVRPAPLNDALLLGLVCDSDRMGALRFADVGNSLHCLGERRFAHPKASDLAELCQTARRIESGDILSAASLERFAENASALGGSRPKAGFTDENGRLCLAKFSSINDDRDKGAWEYVTARLAQKAGIRLPEFQLIDINDPLGRIFASKRFDRTDDGGRLHYLSVRALLGAADNREARSYRDLVALIESICHDAQEQKEELWRRTVFKCFIHDGDDHLRNLGFLLTPNGWELAPAFDLNPSLSKTHLTLSYGCRCRDIAPSALLECVSDWGIPSDRAERIARETAQVVSQWKTEAREAGIAEKEITQMQPAFSFDSDFV